MYIDPLGIPFMQRALGQGELTKRDLKQMQMFDGGAMGSGLAASRQGGMTGPTPAQFYTPPMGSIGRPDTRGPGNGPNPYVTDALFGRSAQLGADGNWIPGRQGFPDYSGGGGGGGGGPPAITAMRGMGSK